jgi:hypothetical protein
MVQIQSTCGSCRTELDLTVADLIILLPVAIEVPDAADEAADSGSDTAPRPRLVHGCDECGETTVRHIEWRMAKLLQAHGVAALPDLELEPAVEPHPENPPVGPALTVDAAIDLHDLLERADWFDELVAAGPIA